MSNFPINLYTPIAKEHQKLIKIFSDETSIIALADSSVTLTLEICNKSDQPLEASKTSNVFLCYKLEQGSQSIEGIRTSLEEDIPAKSTKKVSLLIDLMDYEGDWLIKPTFVQENIAWLNYIDSPTVILNLMPAPCSEQAPYAKNRPILSKSIPAIFNFELTNKCPFSCIMCARTNNMTRQEGLMSLALFKKIIDELDNINSDKTQEMWLHGFGESLVHPEFDKFLSYAINKGFNAGLSINPLLLTRKVAKKLLQSKPKHLYLAIDGHDNNSFEIIRGIKNAYDKSIERLEFFLHLKNKISPSTKIDIGMIDFELNKKSIFTMKTKWEQIDPHVNFVAKSFTTWDGSASDVLSLTNATVNSCKPVTCSFPWTKLTVNWDGKVSPCCYDYNKKYVLGDLNVDSLNDIWNGSPMLELRTEFKSGNVSNPLCKNCQQL